MAKKRKVEVKVEEGSDEREQQASVDEDAQEQGTSIEANAQEQQGYTAEKAQDEKSEVAKGVKNSREFEDEANAPEDLDGNNEDSEDEEGDIAKLLDPFSKEQLVELLKEAAKQHPEVLDRIYKVADADPAHRKIFVHGLGWDTTSESLISAFQKYGEIEDCNAVSDKISGKSKGYGFVLFKNRFGANKALKEPQKRIGNRMTACQLASTGPVPAPAPAPPMSEYTARKIYVSNVSADIDPERLLQFFAKYGEIEEGPLGLDKHTGKPKGFALFVYKSSESARKALEEPHKNFEGHIFHCQKAIDGPKPTKIHNQQPHHASHHPPQPSHFVRSDHSNYMSGMGSHAGPANMMAPAQGGMPFSQAAPAAAVAVNPLSQAVLALVASQGTGLGLTNFLGSLGSSAMVPAVNQNMAGPVIPNAGPIVQGGYGNQATNIAPNIMGGYGSQPTAQVAYPSAPVGHPNTVRSQQAMGHMSAVTPYTGH